jgi:hypothetical protein
MTLQEFPLIKGFSIVARACPIYVIKKKIYMIMKISLDFFEIQIIKLKENIEISTLLCRFNGR